MIFYCIFFTDLAAFKDLYSIETKHLFNEGVSPHIKSLILKRRAGIKLTENEESKLKRFSESVSIVSPTPLHQRQVKLPISNTHDLEFDLVYIFVDQQKSLLFAHKTKTSTGR